MKTSKIFTIDIELAKRLQEEDNASALINQLLTSHYGDPRSEEQIIADVKAQIAKKKADAEFKKKLEAQLKREKRLGLT